MEQFNIYEAKSRLSELVNAASQGQEIILARNGRPLAKLVPYNPQPTLRARGFGSNPSLGIIPDDFDEPLDDVTLAKFMSEIPL